MGVAPKKTPPAGVQAHVMDRAGLLGMLLLEQQ